MVLVCGVGWWIIGIFFHFIFLGLLLAAGIGYAIGEVVGLSVNRKRGAGLAIIAGAGVALSYLVSILLPGGFHFGLINILLDLLALALGIFVAVTRLR